MNDLTEKSLLEVFCEKARQIFGKGYADLSQVDEKEKAQIAEVLQAVASHANAQLQSSLQKCQGEVEELKRHVNAKDAKLQTLREKNLIAQLRRKEWV